MSVIPPIPQTPDSSPNVWIQVKRVLNSLMEGSTNACGTVTLTNGGTTTTLQDNHITQTCKILFWPQTAHAAAITGLWYDLSSVPVSGNQIQKQITLNHSSSAQADLTFGYLIVQ